MQSPRSLCLSILVALAACGDNASPATALSPRIVVVSPDNGAILPVAATTIAFRVEDAAATSYAVTLGDDAPVVTDAPLEVGEQATVALELASGVNTITLTAYGEDETSDEASLVIIYDQSAAPLIVIESPAPGDVTHAMSATIAGRIASSHAITTATLHLGAAPAEDLALVPTPGGYTFAAVVDLALGANDVTLRARDDRAQAAEASLQITRTADEVGPVAAIAFPRDGQAVRTRSVLVRGSVADVSGVDSVTITANGTTVAATVAGDGTFTATVALAPASNELAIVATDTFGNTTELAHGVYYGQRLGSGGGHGGAIVGGRIYTWGRNNLGQTGLDFVSAENRNAFCDRTHGTPRDIALCRATTITLIDAICLNPGFVTPVPSDSAEAAACRAATRTARDAVCDAAGASAPPSCKTSNTLNLATLCDTTYGVATPASNACEARLACDGAYAAGSAEHASCVAVAGAVPSVFPSPATPYTPVAIAGFSLAASPPAATGTGAAFDTLGVTFTSLAFNQNSSSALDSAGRVWSWGDNGNGMLCLGDALERKLPHRVGEFGAPGTTAIALARGYDHLLILRSDGTVWSCGMNNLGQLGDGTSGAAASRHAPVAVQGLPADIVQVLASSQSSYAVTAGGQVYAWGRNQYGNLGNGTASASTVAAPVPALVPGLANVVMIASGRDHVLALTSAGTVHAWGLNASNQIDASDDDVLSPLLIPGITGARAVYANGNQGFYEDPQGRLFGWGQNGSGNLGIPEDDDMPAPTNPVFGLSGVLDVGIGALQGFALRGTQVFAWGWSFHGSLGAGPSAIHTWPYRTPVLVQLP